MVNRASVDMIFLHLYLLISRRWGTLLSLSHTVRRESSGPGVWGRLSAGSYTHIHT